MIEQINSISEMWWNWMWPMFWQVSVLIGVIGSVDFLLRKHIWPQLRYTLWLLILVKLLLPPSFTLPTSIVSRVQPLFEHSLRQLAAPDGPVPHPFVSKNTDSDELVAEGQAQFSMLDNPVVGPAMADNSVQINPSSRTAGGGYTSLSWHAIAMVVWMVVTLLLTLFLLFRHRTLRRVHCAADCAHDLPEWLPYLLDDTAKKLRLRRRPRMTVSSTVNCPAVLGIFRPMLLVPARGIEKLSQEQTEHILLHELAHIKRRDPIVHALCVFLQIFYWFNPLLMLVRRQLQHLRELCCDAKVAAILKDKTEAYSQTILETVEWLLSKPYGSGIGPLGLIEDPGRLRIRLAWLRKKPPRHPALRVAATVILVITIFTCVMPMARAEKPAEGNVPVTGEHEQGPNESLGEALTDDDLEQGQYDLPISEFTKAIEVYPWFAAEAETSRYVFVSEQSTLVRTDGTDGVQMTGTVKGRFELTTDFEAGKALFSQVDTSAECSSTSGTGSRGTGHAILGLTLNRVFNMTGLVGTIVDGDKSIRFDGTASDGSSVQIMLTFADDNISLKGETIPPPNRTVIYTLDAVAEPKYAYGGGSGTADDPYQVATAEDLILLGETLEDYDRHFILTADIDLDPNLPGRKVFDRAVIAPAGDVHFTGVFDGNGHVISHLTIIGGGNYLGLFGQLGRPARVRPSILAGEVKNVGVVDVSIAGSGYFVGGLIGRNYGNVTNCYSTGAVSGNWSVGGLVGSNSWSTVTNCYSTGAVSGDSRVGGLVGYNGGNITTSYSTGRVSKNRDVGGLVGVGLSNDVISCFWDTKRSHQATSKGGIGKTTAEMHSLSTYLKAGWDFVNVWEIKENQTYPYLRKYPIQERTSTGTIP